MVSMSKVRRGELEAQIRQLVEEAGLQQRLIAQRLGVSQSFVERVCRRLQLRTQRTGPRSGEGHPGWKGGRYVDQDGYVLVYKPEHPQARKAGYVLEHRLVAESVLGRLLEPGEVVHHRDRNKQNNDPSNLEVFATNGEHLRLELLGRVPNWTEEGYARMCSPRKK